MVALSRQRERERHKEKEMESEREGGRKGGKLREGERERGGGEREKVRESERAILKAATRWSKTSGQGSGFRAHGSENLGR